MSEQYARLEPYDRDLECERSSDGIQCSNEAEFTITTPMWSDETRTRYCQVHAFKRIGEKMEQWSEEE
jgi:hypothetical protein